MSWPLAAIRNATDLRGAFQELCRREADVFRPTIAQRRSRLAPPRNSAGPSAQDDAGNALEAHIRVCFVDHLLRALNWDLPDVDKLRPTLWTEVPIIGEEDDDAVVLFLDYFGVERESDSPLIVVETKRPEATLPRVDSPPGGGLAPSRAALDVQRRRVAAEVADAITEGLRAEASGGKSRLTKEWRSWLRKMCDYVKAVATRAARVPRRAVFTNGHWLIVFVEPSQTFAGNALAKDVVVFLDRDDLDDRAEDLFALLAFENVSEEMRPLAPEEVALLVEPASINGYMHGLRLLHAEKETMFANALPRLAVSPILLLRSSHGRWVEVIVRREREIPLDGDLNEHVRLIADDAQELLTATRRALAASPPVVSLREHFGSEEQVRVLPGVVRLRERDAGRTTRDFRVLTGKETHFIRIDPAAVGCAYHGWSACSRDGRAFAPSPEAVPTFQPRRNFFVEGRPHHCAHQGVSLIKSAPLPPSTGSQAGIRSGKVGDAFCEVFAFDHTLCCRNCAFEEACASAPAFVLPCTDEITRRRLPVL